MFQATGHEVGALANLLMCTLLTSSLLHTSNPSQQLMLPPAVPPHKTPNPEHLNSATVIDYMHSTCYTLSSPLQVPRQCLEVLALVLTTIQECIHSLLRFWCGSLLIEVTSQKAISNTPFSPCLFKFMREGKPFTTPGSPAPRARDHEEIMRPNLHWKDTRSFLGPCLPPLQAGGASLRKLCWHCSS